MGVRMNFLKRVLIVGLLLAGGISQAACKKPGLKDFSVYTLESIHLRNSDYQGLVGSAENITAEHFFIKGSKEHCLGISAGGHLSLTDGQVALRVEAATYKTTRVHLPYGISSQMTVSHAEIEKELETLWHQFGLLIENANVNRSPSTIIISKKDPAQTKLVANLSHSEFQTAKRIVIRAAKGDQVVLLVFGVDVVMNDMDIVLEGGVDVMDISWVFPNALSLKIARTANPTYGIPGLFYAPMAAVWFHSGLITGGLYVKSLPFPTQLGMTTSSGQVNRPIEVGDKPSK